MTVCRTGRKPDLEISKRNKKIINLISKDPRSIELKHQVAVSFGITVSLVRRICVGINNYKLQDPTEVNFQQDIRRDLHSNLDHVSIAKKYNLTSTELDRFISRPTSNNHGRLSDCLLAICPRLQDWNSYRC